MRTVLTIAAVSTLMLKRLTGMGWKTFHRRKRITRCGRIAMTAKMFDGDTLYAETEVLEAAPVGCSLGCYVCVCLDLASTARKLPTLNAGWTCGGPVPVLSVARSPGAVSR